MANDRLGGDSVPLTHEFLSLMLGVRRAGVTVALHFLEQRGIIHLARKQIFILDREGLAPTGPITSRSEDNCSNFVSRL